MPEKMNKRTVTLNNKKPDQIFTFYATSKAYRNAGELENEGEKINVEIKYREDGLVTNRYAKTTNLKTIVTIVKTVEYTYSK